MYSYFYNFFKGRFAVDLFTRDQQDGTTAPPSSEERITEAGIVRITEDGQERITE